MSAVQWAVAKFLPDARRNEPRNVGVLLWGPDGVRCRFQGSGTEAGAIDGRAVPRDRDLNLYKSWVDYLTWAASKKRPLESLVGSRRPGDPYYLEAGGEVLAGDAGDLEVLLTLLFTTLVDDDREETSFRDQVREAIDAAGLPDTRGWVDDGLTMTATTNEVYTYPFGYRNGSTAVGVRAKALTNQLAKKTLWEAEHLPSDVRFVVIVGKRPASDATVDYLSRRAHIVPLSENNSDDLRHAFLG